MKKLHSRKNTCRNNNVIASRQSGYLMISAMIALLVISALLVLSAEKEAEHGRLRRGEQLGYAIGRLGAALNVYIDTNFTELAVPHPHVPDVVDALHPTAEELIHLVNIEGVSPVPPVIAGASYKFQVTYPNNCSSSQKLSKKACQPVGLAYLDEPLMRGGGTKVDYVALARGAHVMKGQGGYSSSEDPAHFAFPTSTTVKAPIYTLNPTNKAGLLAWRGAYSPRANAGPERLRTDGSNQMKADLRLDGNNTPHDIHGARTINASSISSEALKISGDEVVTGNLSVAGDSLIKGNQSVQGWVEAERGVWTTTMNSSGIARIGGWLETKGDKLATTEVEVDRNATFAKNLTVHEHIITNSLYLSPEHNEGQPCSTKWAIGMTKNSRLVYCDYRLQWQEFASHIENPDPMDYVQLYEWQSKLRYNPTVNFGRHLYCRPHNRNSGEIWLDKESNGEWTGKAKWLAGRMQVLCFG